MKHMILVSTVIVSAVLFAADVNWTLDSREWQNFNTPLAWSNELGPQEGDYANIGTAAGQVSKVRIDTELPQLKRICISTKANATSIVEIASGGKVVLTNDWNKMLYLNAGKDGRGVDAWSELHVTGGTLEFNDLEPGEGNMRFRGAIGIGFDYASSGHARVLMTSGRIFMGNGISVGHNSAVNLSASYEQTGGRLEFGTGGSGFKTKKNGTVTVTGGEIVRIDSANMEFEGPALFKNCLFEFGALDVSNHVRDPESSRAFVVGEGASVTDRYTTSFIRINDGLLRLEEGGSLSSFYGGTGGQLQLNAGEGQVSHFQMNGGFFRTAYFNFANSSKGACRYVQTGGTTMGCMYISAAKPQAEPVYLEVSGGSFSFSGQMSYGFPVVENACTNSMVFCIRGTPDKVEYLRTQKTHVNEGSNTGPYTNRMHHLFQIDPRGLTPLTVNNSKSGSGASIAGRFSAHCSVHPWGGAQLIATNQYVLVHGTANLSDYNNAADYAYDFTLARPDSRLWTWGHLPYKNYSNDKNFGVTLNEDAKVENGFRSAQGVPLGYFEIPPIRRGTTLRVSIRMGLVPKGEKTLADIVAELNEKSGCKAILQEAGGTNVRVDLPLERLGDKSTDRKFLFDFTREESPKAFERGELITDAVVTALDFERQGAGFILLVK